jgi:hypothetical protein
MARIHVTLTTWFNVWIIVVCALVVGVRLAVVHPRPFLLSMVGAGTGLLGGVLQSQPPSAPTQARPRLALGHWTAVAPSGLAVRRLEGAKETLIRATVSGTDAEVFIYENGAQLLGPDVDKRLEVLDYRDGDALAGAFVHQTAEDAKPRAPHS